MGRYCKLPVHTYYMFVPGIRSSYNRYIGAKSFAASNDATLATDDADATISYRIVGGAPALIEVRK